MRYREASYPGIYEEMGMNTRVAVWVGPGHVQDFYAGRPSCMVIASHQINLTKYLVGELNSSLIRFYYGQDLIGCEMAQQPKTSWGLRRECSTELIVPD